jgi:hypothetical protein
MQCILSRIYDLDRYRKCLSFFMFKMHCIAYNFNYIKRKLFERAKYEYRFSHDEDTIYYTNRHFYVTRGCLIGSRNCLFFPSTCIHRPDFGRVVLLILLVFLCCVAFWFDLSSFCVVFPMLPVSLSYQFLLVPSVFSNVYFPSSLCPLAFYK